MKKKLPTELMGNRKIQKPLQESLALQALVNAATEIATKYKISLFELLKQLSNLMSEINTTTNKEDFRDD